MITFSKLGQYGRLGNQMFQIASTIGIALRNNQVYAFPEWKYQKYFRHILPETKVFPKEKYHEGHPYYRDINLSVSADLEGYFQSWKYFDHCKDFIKRQFDFNRTPVDKVAIHVRRGDYLERQNIHPLLSTDYYEDAIRKFPFGTEYTIFSDDIEWCMNRFTGYSFDFSVGKSDIEDLQFMANHKGVIMANSSFSWWAGYLCDGRVVAPSKYVIGEERDDRIPPEWIKI